MLKRRYPQAVNIFYCYAHEDERLQEQLERHLSNLRRQGLINDWHYRDIIAGQSWRKEIDEHLNTAHIVLLLISANFMRSDYCHSVEMTRALERHHNGETRVIPILLKQVDFTNAPFSGLQMLPKGQKPVTSWSTSSRDKVFTDIVLEIRKIIYEILGKHDPIDKISEQHTFIDASPKKSWSTRAANPYTSKQRTRSKSSKQNPVQVLADTADARIFKRTFPKTNKKPILEDVKELLTAIEFSDLICLNPRKFKRYFRKKIRSSEWFLFLGFDVALTSWGIYNWIHSLYGAIATCFIMLSLFLWNSINESTFASVLLTLLFTGIWCSLGAMYLQSIPFIHAQFIIIIVVSLLCAYLRLELFKPTR